MRTLHPQELENRKKKLLQAVIYHYVRTAKPVGSHIIVDKYNFGMSSATVRNLLGDLEKEGFIIQPHTSAGRVPTDKGYRFYVDSLIEIQSMAVTEEERIRKEYQARIKEIEDVMVQTSHMLSSLSKYAGMVLSPRLDKSLLRHLQLIPLGGNQILVVVVSRTGQIRHRVVSPLRPIGAERLNTISTILNERLVGLPLSEVRHRILDHIEAAEQDHEETFRMAKELVREAFGLQSNEGELYVEGKENIFSFPDFRDYSELSSLIRVVEQKHFLAGVLGKAMKGEGVMVKIGAENKYPELRGVSLVSSTYKMGDNPVGVLGILGPRRMEYGRMIALVEGVTKVLNQILERMNLP